MRATLFSSGSPLAPSLAIAWLACAAGCSSQAIICHGPGCEEGACEGSRCGGATKVYRSVGPGESAPLAIGESNPLVVRGGRATFAAALPDRVGVGDVILYSESGSLVPSAVAFVAGRVSGMVFTVQGERGGPATETQAPDVRWSIFRAYTSLADAVLGRTNRGLPDGLATFDQGPGANDLIGANLAWNIACYADAPDAIDTTAVILRSEGWITGPDNYLRLFSPSSPAEVGQSQRHHGAYDATKYQLVRTANGGDHLIDVFVDFVRIEGLQIVDRAPASSDANINVELAKGGAELRLQESILLGNRDNARGASGIMVAGQAQGRLLVWNNVVGEFSGPCFFDNTIPGTQVEVYLYSNTFYDCSGGIDARFAATLAKNMIIGGIPSSSFCVSDVAAFSVLSDYNTCNLPGEMRGSHSWPGSSVTFADPGAGDFHLAAVDAVAAGHGLDLSSDPVLPFHDDIDGEPRRGAWDIGADQR